MSEFRKFLLYEATIYLHDQTTATKEGEQLEILYKEESTRLEIFFNRGATGRAGETADHQGGVDEGAQRKAF